MKILLLLPNLIIIQAEKQSKDLTAQNFYIQNTADKNCVQNHCDFECHSEQLQWYNTKPECINCIRFNACLKSGWLKKDEFHKCGKTRCKDVCVRNWNSEKCGVCMAENCVKHEKSRVEEELQVCGRKCAYTGECNDLKSENSVCFSDCQLECHSTRSSAVATVGKMMKNMIFLEFFIFILFSTFFYSRLHNHGLR